MIVTKPLILPKLQTELQAAGIPVRGLISSVGAAGESLLFATSPEGKWIELPAGAQAVIDAHDGTPPPAPDFGTDAPDDYKDRLADAVSQLRAYLALATPTQAQSTAALRLTIRLALFLARRLL